MINMLLILFFTTFSLAETHTVTANNFSYQPSTLSINVNDSVEFINDGGFHDVVVTSGPELLELPACSGPCNIGTLTFTVPGTYDYICSIGSHASMGMIGTIIVEDSDNGSEASCSDGTDVCLTLDGGNLDYTSASDIAGFQFSHNGCVDGAAGGDATANGFTVSASGTTVLAFSFTGSVVPAGEGTLVELSGDVSEDCLSSFIFSDINGSPLSVEFAAELADDGGDDGSDDGGNTETASVQVIHNSASPTVDVYIDGALAVEDFAYRTATPVLELGTSFTVGIAPAGEAVIAEFPFELMDGGEYVVVATGLLGNTDTPFDLAAASTTFGATEGNVGLEVYHGSTDAPAVDVLADGAVLVPNLSYGSFSGYVEVPAADYVVGVAPTGGASIADFVAPLSDLGGNSAVVFASGFLSGDDPAFGLFAALADGTVLELPANVSDEECTANVCLSLSNGMLDYISDTDIAGFQFNHDGCVTSAGGGDAEANGFTVSSSATAVLGFSFTGSVVPSGMGTLLELEGDVSFDCLSNYVFSDSAGGALTFGFISDDDPVETASVQVIHNSASPTVDVYIDGALAVEDFAYRTATPVLELGTSLL